MRAIKITIILLIIATIAYPPFKLMTITKNNIDGFVMAVASFLCCMFLALVLANTFNSWFNKQIKQ